MGFNALYGRQPFHRLSFELGGSGWSEENTHCKDGTALML
jgi:hypothetical protein